MLEPGDDGLPVPELARRPQPAQGVEGLGPAIKVIGDDESAHRRALHVDLVDVDQPAPPGALARVVVLRHHAAQEDLGVEVQPHEQVVHDRAADVLEVEIDTVRGSGVKQVAPGRVTVIDARIEAEFVNDVAALGRAARDADHPGAAQLRQLTGDRPHAARRGRDHHGLSRTRVQVVDAQVGADADVPEHAEERRSRRRQRRGQRGQRGLEQPVVGDAELLPAEESGHHVSLAEVGAPGGDHFADADTAYHLPDRDRRHERPLVPEPDPAGRLHRQHQRADQSLAVLQRRHGGGDQLQVGGGQRAGRAPAKPPSPVHGCLVRCDVGHPCSSVNVRGLLDLSVDPVYPGRLARNRTATCRWTHTRPAGPQTVRAAT